MNNSLKISGIALAAALTVTLITSASGAQSGMRYHRSQGVPGVQLTSEQQHRIDGIRNETQNSVQSSHRDYSLTREQRNSKITEAQRQGHDRVMASLTDQQRRQLDNRWQARTRSYEAGSKIKGHSSMGADFGQGVPGVKLTSDQKSRIATIREEMRSRIQSIRKDNSLTRAEREEEILEAQRQGHERVIATLSSDQRRQLDDHWSDRPGFGKDSGNYKDNQRMHGGGNSGKNKH